MLKATWLTTTVAKPLARSRPKSASTASKAWEKNISIITAMVTSGMMIGRYRRASKTLRPRNRNRSSARADIVPSTVATTVDTSATRTDTPIVRWIRESSKSRAYHSVVKPPHCPGLRLALNEYTTNRTIGA